VSKGKKIFRPGIQLVQLRDASAARPSSISIFRNASI